MATMASANNNNNNTTIVKANVTATASVTATAAALHSIGGMMPHGLGLLTTVASLPPKYRSRYLNIKTRCEIPLDLSVKPMSPQIANDVPMATTFTEVYTEPSVEQASAGSGALATDAADLLIASIATAVAQEHEQQQQQQQQQQLQQKQAITPPTSDSALTPTPLKRKWVERERAERERETAAARKQMKFATTAEEPTVAPTLNATTATTTTAATTTTTTMVKKECLTPNKPIRVSDAAPRTAKSQPSTAKAAAAKNKATRKLKFDEETSSPVSGTIIRPLEDVTDGTMQYSNGDIDPRYNIVEITEETKAELAAIKNVIGDYICKLCRIRFDDAFGLAQHRCACIVLLEYRCPECGKQFNCPANLASHRRWHKPKKGDTTSAANGAASNGVTSGGTGATKKESRQHNGNAATQSQQSSSGNRKVEELEHTCDQCGKQFKRLAYLRKHQLTHNNNNNNTNKHNNNNNNNNGNNNNGKKSKTTTIASIATAPAVNVLMTVNDYQSNASSTSLSAASSVHSFVTGSHEEVEPERTYTNTMATTATAAAIAVAAVNSQRQQSNSHGDYVHVVDNADDDDDENDDDEDDSMSAYSSGSSSAGYGRLQIVESGLTEEENIAAAALTNLRNCASVIQHTTMAH